ncbi:MAG: FtsW/RodA/SpoVE family cell cycle protein [Evtepia sp.]|uniref:FtsW/RodA/SpoVE family cell cycle protein n=1 Tax=Evtepia sp. TaxID=2773933 RepID=UPI002A764774|nr:FtsW/RodA/SpoVE family cell cycle protein [Evtepia sp.]MDY3015383.1 FtsW/RodA/SpoVE family cell cycle protein [Evtepia sp.]
MQELIARLGVIFSQLGDQVRAALENAAPGKGLAAVIDVVLPVACGVLRVIAIIFAILIIVRCLMSLLRDRPGKEIWGWLTMENGTRFDLYHWENSVGRSRRSDVELDFPTVSRSHVALLRDDKGNWKLQPLQTKNGTRVNGKKIAHTVPVKTGDVIDLGGLPLTFYAISEEEEREQAMRFGVAERPLRPGKTLGYLTVFQIMMAVQCLPGREAQEVAMIAASFGILCACMWGMYILYRFLKRTAFEAETIAFFLCTLSFSVTAAYSPKGLLTQTICVILGLALFIVLSVLLRDLKSTVSLRWPIAVFTCLLLVFNVLLGQRLFGAKNWISLGPISFQPSEFVKVAFIFTGAATLDRLFARRNLIFTVLFCGFCMGCLALMSDFGTALIFFVALLVIAFLRSGDLGFLALMGTAAAAGGWMILRFKPYIANRFSAWRHVWEFSTEPGGYQQTRTMSAIASGGLFGKGTEDSFLKKVGAANTDLVFGVISEEFGLIMALCTVFVLLVLTVYAVRCATTARSSYYVIAANSAAAMLVFQATLNVLGAVDILPLTGVTLPFVSMGGSSMISCWGLLAFIKAADTRPNASFTLKLPKRIRGWIPPDSDGIYDDRYSGWYDDYDDYAYDDGYDEEYDDGYDRDYDDGYGPYEEDYGYDRRDQAAPGEPPGGWDLDRDPGSWDDLLDGPLWPKEEDPMNWEDRTRFRSEPWTERGRKG